MDASVRTDLDLYLTEAVNDVFARRVKAAPQDIITSVTGKPYAVGKVWDFSDYVLLAAMPPSSLESHQRMHKRFGHPFPALISTTSPEALFSMSDLRDAGIEGATLDLGRGTAIRLGHDCTFCLKGLRIKARRPEGRIDYVISLLFGVSFGEKIPRAAMVATFDGIVTKVVSRELPHHGF